MGGRCHRNRNHLMRWMHLRLHAPLGAFGGESVDARGVIRDFPAQSMMTGLIANALGWSRTMTEEHQALQDRIVFGALWEDDVPLGRLTDYQTGSLNKDDQAWTTRGAPARRAGGPGTYEGSHQRWRDYHSDLRLAVVLRFEPDNGSPTMDHAANALVHPARPLFIGRKPCLPSAPIFAGWIDAPNAPAALTAIARNDAPGSRACWPASEGTEGAVRITSITDERNFLTGLHGGARRICEGRLPAPEQAG